MKKFFLLSLLGISLSSYILYEVNPLDIHHLFGTCSADNSYCNACTNCNYCRNCAKNGGSCAVCYTPSAVTRRSIPVKSYRSERPISSNSNSSIHSGSPTVKGYHFRKSSPLKYTSSRRTIAVDPAIAELPSQKDSTESNFSTDVSFTNKMDSGNRLEPIPLKLLSTTEKEFFTIDIPENAEFVRITASVANLREETSTKSRILQRLQHRDLLIRLKAIKGWMKVQALDSGEVGYVSKNLLN